MKHYTLDDTKSFNHKWVLVTPEIAQRWLEKVDPDRQRNQRPRRIAAYAADMKAGNWSITGQTIAFDLKGRLIDGQNRMQAVLMSGATIPFLVVTNLPEAAIMDLDHNAPRSTADSLKLEGYENPSFTASMSRAMATCFLTLKSRSSDLSFTHGMAMEVCEEFKHDIDAVREYYTSAPNYRTGAIYAAAAVCRNTMAEGKQLDMFEEFCSQAIQGHMVAKNSPADRFRKFLASPRVTGRKGNSEVGVQIMSAFCSCLSHFMEGVEELASIRPAPEAIDAWVKKVDPARIKRVQKVCGIA